MPQNDWSFLGSSTNSGQTGLWTKHGIFSRNTVTGELRLGQIEGALAGLSDAYMGRVENSEFKKNVNFIFPDNSVLTDSDIDDSLYLGYRDEEDDNYLERLFWNTVGSQQQTWGGRIFGLLESTADINEGLWGGAIDLVGADGTAVGQRIKSELAKNTSEIGDIRRSVEKEAVQNIAAPDEDGGIVKNLLKGDFTDALDRAALGGTNAAVDLALTRGLAASAAMLARTGQAVRPLTSSITAAIYGADTFQSVYNKAREDESSRLSSFGVASTAAVATSALERISQQKMFQGRSMDDIVQNHQILGSAITEGTTEHLQGMVEKYATTAFDDETAWDVSFFGNAILESMDDAIIGAGIGAGSTTIAGLMHKGASDPITRIELDKLTQGEKEALAMDLGALKRTFETVVSEDGSSFTPAQLESTKFFLAKWGKVDKVESVLKNALASALDPTRKATDEELSEISNEQVFDQPITQFEEKLDTDTTAAYIMPKIQEPAAAWSMLESPIDAETNKQFQVAAQLKLDAVEWLLDNQGAFDFNDMMESNYRLMDLYTSGNAKRLAPAQRERLTSLHRRMADVSQDAEGMSILETMEIMMESDLQKSSEHANIVTTGLVSAFRSAPITQADSAGVLDRATSLVNRVVDEFGTDLSEENARELSSALDDILSIQDQIGLSTEEEMEQAKNLDLAAKKIASILPPGMVPNARMKPMLGRDFLIEVKSAENNFLGEMNASLELARAIVASIEASPAIEAYNAALKSGADEPTLQQLAAQIPPDAPGVYGPNGELINNANGIPGLSVRDILKLVKNRDMHRGILQRAGLVLSEDEMANLRAMLNIGAPITKDYKFDWQDIKLRGEERVSEMVREWAQTRAKELAAKGQGGDVVRAMQTPDVQVSRKRANDIKTAWQAHLEVVGPINKALKSLYDDMRLAKARGEVSRVRAIGEAIGQQRAELAVAEAAKNELSNVLDKMINDTIDSEMRTAYNANGVVDIKNAEKADFDEAFNLVLELVDSIYNDGIDYQALSEGADMAAVFTEKVNDALARADLLERKAKFSDESIMAFAEHAGINPTTQRELLERAYSDYMRSVENGNGKPIRQVFYNDLLPHHLRQIVIATYFKTSVSRTGPTVGQEVAVEKRAVAGVEDPDRAKNPGLFTRTGIIDPDSISAKDIHEANRFVASFAGRMIFGHPDKGHGKLPFGTSQDLTDTSTENIKTKDDISTAIDSVRTSNFFRRLILGANDAGLRTELIKFIKLASSPFSGVDRIGDEGQSGKPMTTIGGWTTAQIEAMRGEVAYRAKQELDSIGVGLTAPSAELVGPKGIGISRGNISIDQHGERSAVVDGEVTSVVDSAKTEFGGKTSKTPIQKEISQLLNNPEAIMLDGRFSEGLRATARKLVEMNGRRTETLRMFYRLAKSAGYRVGVDAEWFDSAVYGNPMTNKESAKALKTVETLYNNVSAAMKQKATPAGLASTLMAKGYGFEHITNQLSLIDGIAATYEKRTGQPRSRFYDKIIGNLSMTDPATQGGLYFGGAFSALTKIQLAAVDPKYAGQGFTSMVPIHELLHGLLESGILSEMLSPVESKAVQTWLGMKALPTRGQGGKIIGRPNDQQAESFVQAVLSSIAGRAVPGPVGKAVRSIRHGMLNYISSLMGKGMIPEISKINIMDGALPEDVENALVGLFSDNTYDKLLHIQDNKAIAIAKVALREGVLKEVGIDITPLLQRGSQNAADVSGRIIRLLGKDDPYSEDGGVSDKMRNFDTFLDALYGDGADIPVEDIAALRDIHKKVVLSLIDASSGAGPLDLVGGRKSRLYEKVKKNDQIVDGTVRPMEPTIVDAAKTEVLNISKPLANKKLDNVLSGIDQMLGLLKVHVFTNKEGRLEGKSLKQYAGNWLRTMRKSWETLTDSRTFGLERSLQMLGLTSEWLRTHNIGGLYAQAAANIDEGVIVDDGFSRRVINEPLSAIIDEIPDEMYDDVFRYMAAMREIEVSDWNDRKLRDWVEKKAEYDANPVGDEPERPKLKHVYGKNRGAAEVLKTYIEMKYGKDGGPVAEFAKRISKFSRAAIVDKLHFYGMLSDQDHKNLTAQGQHWIPLVNIDEIMETSGMEPIFNDGTKEAMRALRSDLDQGIEHPLTNIAKRAAAVHIFVERQRVRNALLNSLIEGSSDEDLMAMGIEQAMTRVSEKITKEEFDALPPDQRRSYIKALGRKDKDVAESFLSSGKALPPEVNRELSEKGMMYTRMVDKPVSRASYQKWFKENSAAPGSPTKSVYALWKNGEASYYVIKDQELLAAMESLRPSELSFALKAFRGFKKVLFGVLKGAGVATRYFNMAITHAPQFLLNMPFRDFQNALVKSQTGLTIFDFPLGFIEALPALFPGFAKEFPNSFKLWNERRLSLAQQTSLPSTYQDEGRPVNIKPHSYKKEKGGSALHKAGMAIYKGNFLPTIYSNREKMFGYQDFHSASLLKKLWFYTKTSGQLTWETTGKIGSFLDAGVRLAERRLAKKGYVGLRQRLKMASRSAKNLVMPAEKGKEAGFIYSDLYVDFLDRMLTLDFSRRGEAVSIFSKFKMFAGPTFQDWNQTAGLARNPQRLKSVAMKGVIAFTIPALLNFARFHDDEDWKKMNYWDKFNYIHLSKNDDGTFNRLPWGIGMLSAIFKDFPIAAAQYASGNDPDAFREWVNQLIQQTPLQYLPVPKPGESDYKQSLTEYATSGVTPTAVEPMVEIAANYDAFTNTPIDYDAGRSNTLLPEERGREKVGVIEYALAKTGLYGLSARQWGHVTRNYFPGIAGDVYGAVNQAATSVYRNVTDDNLVGQTYDPISRSTFNFKTGSPYGPSSLPVNRLYDLHKRASQAKKTWEDLLERGAESRADDILKKYPELMYAPGIKSTYGEIMRLKIERAQFMKNNSDLDRETLLTQVRELYDKPMTMIANDMVNMFYEDTRHKPKEISDRR